MSTQAQTNRIVPRSIVRYRPIAPEADQSTRRGTDEEIPPWHRRSHTFAPKTEAFASSSVFLAAVVGCGMAIALLLILVGQLVMGWAQIALDDWQYGRPRTAQVDQYVGHEQRGQKSHFLALNNQGRVEVIELSGNDPTRARIFLGPQLTGAHADLAPVTLRFVDPHHTHYPDLMVYVGTVSILFHNTHETFVLQQS